MRSIITLLLAISGIVLCSQIKVYGQDIPPLPKAAVLPPSTNVWKIEAFTQPSDCGSSVLYWTNSVRTNAIPIAWEAAKVGCDPSITNIQPVTGYVFSYTRLGTSNTYYLQVSPTNRFAILPLPVAPLKTNRIVTITSQNATNIRYRPPGGTWKLLNRTNLSDTNPPVPVLQYQAMGASKAKPGELFIDRRIE